MTSPSSTMFFVISVLSYIYNQEDFATWIIYRNTFVGPFFWGLAFGYIRNLKQHLKWGFVNQCHKRRSTSVQVTCVVVLPKCIPFQMCNWIFWLVESHCILLRVGNSNLFLVLLGKWKLFGSNSWFKFRAWIYVKYWR